MFPTNQTADAQQYTWPCHSCYHSQITSNLTILLIAYANLICIVIVHPAAACTQISHGGRIKLSGCVLQLLYALLGSRHATPASVPAKLSLMAHFAASKSQHQHAETSSLQSSCKSVRNMARLVTRNGQDGARIIVQMHDARLCLSSSTHCDPHNLYFKCHGLRTVMYVDV